jgi:hypothetical protein
MKAFSLIAIVFFLVNCKKSNVNDHPEYKGMWVGETSSSDIVINVKDDGAATYDEVSPGVTKNFSGPFIVDGSEVKIATKKLTIEEAPHEVGSVTHMKLSGVDYARK